MTRVTIRKPILRPFGCPDGVRVASGVSQVFTAFVTSLAGSLGVVSAPNRHKPETVPSGLKGQVEETVAITSLRSHQVVAIRIKSRRSFPATGQGILPWHCLHASTKCRPQSATPRPPLFRFDHYNSVWHIATLTAMIVALQVDDLKHHDPPRGIRNSEMTPVISGSQVLSVKFTMG